MTSHQNSRSRRLNARRRRHRNNLRYAIAGYEVLEQRLVLDSMSHVLISKLDDASTNGPLLVGPYGAFDGLTLESEPVATTSRDPAIPAGAEFQVNNYSNWYQRSPAMSMAVDGSFVVAWESYLQDGNYAGIFAQRFDAAGQPLGAEFQVNTFTSYYQISPSVAMAADGRFVIAWEGTNQDGSSYGVFAQRYDENGTPAGAEFQVNTHTNDSQRFPSVVMSDDGSFIVAWQSWGQDGSGDGIYAQRYDAAGSRQGTEFQVNTQTNGSQRYAAIANLAEGGVVIAWASSNQDGSGFGIFAQRYNAAGSPEGGEFQVNMFTSGNQTFPEIATVENGGFVIVWESDEQDGSGKGIFARSYDSDGSPAGIEFQVNTIINGDQSSPAIASGPNGGFIVTWESDGQDGNGDGVFAQRFDLTAAPVGIEFPVNSYTSGDQVSPAVAMSADGNFIVAWTSDDQDGSSEGIFAQRFEIATSQVAYFSGWAWEEQNGNHVRDESELGMKEILVRLYNETGTVLGSTVTDNNGQYEFSDIPIDASVHVRFMPPSDWTFVKKDQGDSDTNDSDVAPETGWSDGFTLIAGDGQLGPDAGFVLPARISGQVYNDVDQDTEINGRDLGVAGWLVYLDENENAQWDFDEPSAVTDSDGNYFLTELFPGEYLVRTVDRPHWASSPQSVSLAPGASIANLNFANHSDVPYLPTTPDSAEFLVNTHIDGLQSNAATSISPDSSFVVVWESSGQDGSGNGIFAQRYDTSGATLGTEFQVNTFTSGYQSNPAVAIDSNNGFVVTWESANQDGNSWGIFAQRYNAAGESEGTEFQVNTHTDDAQQSPGIAMAADGSFAITWQSYEQEGSLWGVYVQRFDASGNPVGSEIQVNTYTSGSQNSPEIAMSSDGSFVIVWESSEQDGSDYGVFARHFDQAGVPLTTEFQVNTYTSSRQNNPYVAMSSEGSFTIAWQSWGQDGSNYGIFAQQYDATGVPIDVEFQVNSYTGNSQETPAIAMSSDGGLVIAWRSIDQDGSGNGIFAQRYAAGLPIGKEFRVNTHMLGHQQAPTVAMANDGSYLIAWESIDQDGSNYGIFAQSYDVLSSPLTSFSGLAWDDSNGNHLHDEGEPGLEGLQVNLYNGNEAFIASTTTDANGNYEFSRVPANWDLLVEVVGPSGRILVSQDQGNNDNQDSDIDPTTGWSEVFTLTTGNVQSGPDAGFVLPATIAGKVYNDTNQNGEFDSDELGLASWFVFLDENANAKWDPEEARVITGVTGNYEFRELLPGEYHVRIVEQPHWTTTASQSISLDPGALVSDVHFASTTEVLRRPTDPVGPEFQVNSYTTNAQSQPATAIAADGSFIVVWESYGQDALSTDGIFAQRYDADGISVGTEFQVNRYTSRHQAAPTVAMSADGAFVIAWHGEGTGDTSGVFAQRFDASGTPLGTEFRVNTITSGSQNSPSLAISPDGSFVISWRGYTEGSYEIFAQRFDPSGLPVGSQFLVNTFTENDQSAPVVVVDLQGGFVIAWQSDSQDGSEEGIFAQRFDATGLPLGTEFQVNSHSDNVQSSPTIATISDGSFVIAWESFAQDEGNSSGIFAQRFDADGAPIGAEFQVNTHTIYNQSSPSIGMSAAGGFVIAWESDRHQDGSGDGVFAQHYDLAGVPVGAEFQVNTYTNQDQSSPSIAMDDGGGFVITWQSYNQDSFYEGIFAQRYVVTGSPVVNIQGISVYEGDAGTVEAQATVRLSKPSDTSITVYYSTADGTALAEDDYLPIELTQLTFAPGEVQKTILIEIQSDLLDEPNKQLFLDLSAPVGAVIGEGRGVISILDDDRRISVTGGEFVQSIADVAIGEFVVSIPYVSNRTIAVQYATNGGSAIAGEHYAPVSGTLVFAPGQTQKVISVELMPDSFVEEGRTIRLQLSNPANAELESDEFVVPLRGRPDLIISAIMPSRQLLSGQTFPMTWTIINQGNSPATGSWTDRVYFSDDTEIGNDTLARAFVFSGTIAPGESLQRTQDITIPVSMEGKFWAIIQSNVFDKLIEHSHSNNTLVGEQPFDVSLSASANLQVVDIDGPSTAFAGSEVIVQWTITNIGTGSTDASAWFDGVWLSRDEILDASDVFLGDARNASFLNVGESYVNSLAAMLPEEISEEFHFIVMADHRNQVLELSNEGDNSLSSSPVDIELPPTPDLQVTDIRTDNSSVFSGGTIGVSWDVENRGLGDTRTASWYDVVYLRDERPNPQPDLFVGQFLRIGSLSYEEGYSTPVRTITIPIDWSGDYSIVVRTDEYDVVEERGFDGNNELTQALEVLLTPPPDLEVPYVSVAGMAVAGNHIAIDLTTANNGSSAPVVSSWSNTFYLSTDKELDPTEDILLGSDNTILGRAGGGSADTNLQPGELLTRSHTFTLPLDLAGEYYVIVVADSDDNVFELDNANNTGVSNGIVQVTSEPADLAVVNVSAPKTSEAGTSILVRWTITNHGLGDTIQSRWTDRVYLSSNETLDVSEDRLLRSFNYVNYVGTGVGGPLEPGQAYSRNETIPLPFDLLGSYYLFVLTDYGDQVFESTNEGNNASFPTPIEITRQTPNLQVSNVSSVDSAESTDLIEVTWTVRNTGVGETNVSWWEDDVYLSTDRTLGTGDIRIGRVTHSGVLIPGGDYTTTRFLQIPAELSGDYFVLVATDRSNRVLEGSLENDNYEAATTVTHISLNPVPDLVVTSVDAPLTAISGQSFDISWTVENQGADSSQSAWDDYVYLSLDQVFDPGTDIYLGHAHRSESIAAGQAYTVAQSFSIPAGRSGPFFVFVVSDGGSTLNERDGEGSSNVNFDPVSMQVNLLPPADLIAGSIIIPADSMSGQMATILYTVTNQGLSAASGNWYDSVYISSDAEWSLDDSHFGRFRHIASSGDVAPGTSYSGIVTATLPGLLPGKYHVIVRSDIRNAVPESIETNNLSVSMDRFELSIPELTVGIDAEGALDFGQELYYKIEVPADKTGEALVVNLEVENANTANQLYVRYGAPPSRSEFDLSYTEALNQNQRLVIPEVSLGTYYIFVVGDPQQIQGGFLGNYTLSAEYVQFTVFNEFFGQGGTAGNRTIEIDGVKLDRTVTAFLSDGNGFELPAMKYYRTSETKLYATFDLTGVGPGFYDVILEKSTSGERIEINEGLEVVLGGGGNNKPFIDAPDAIRRPQHDPPTLLPFFIRSGNDGINDVRAPYIRIDSSGPMSLNGDDIFSVISGNAQLNGFEYSTLSGSSITRYVLNEAGGPAGIILPGQNYDIAVYALVDPDPNPLEISVKRLGEHTPSQAFHWEDINLAVLQGRLSTSVFAESVNRLKAEIGTWDEFLDLISDIATRTLSGLSGDARIVDLVNVRLQEIAANLSFSIIGRVAADTFSIEISGREVVAMNLDNGEVYSTTTLIDGSFVIPEIASGDYEVYVPTGAGEKTSVTIGSESTQSHVTLKLLPGKSISGRVVNDNTGLPLENAIIRVMENGNVAKSGITDSEGQFSIEGLLSGSYEVIVDMFDFGRKTLSNVDVNQDVELGRLSVRRGASIFGEVTSHDMSREPLGIIAVGESDESEDLYLGLFENESFSFHGLPAGRYKLEILYADSLFSLTTVDVLEGEIRQLPEFVIPTESSAQQFEGEFLLPGELTARLLLTEAVLRSQYLPRDQFLFGFDSRRLYDLYLSTNRESHVVNHVPFNDGSTIVEGSAWIPFNDGFRNDLKIEKSLKDVFREAAQFLAEEFHSGKITLCDENFNAGRAEYTIDELAGKSIKLSQLVATAEQIHFGNFLSIAGHIAGGINDPFDLDSRGGEFGQIHQDTRKLTGSIEVFVDSGDGKIYFTSKMKYTVKDTIDFVPGDPGFNIEQAVTRPMALLEKYGWAFDVPFAVSFSDKREPVSIDMPKMDDECKPGKRDDGEDDANKSIDKSETFDPNDIIGPSGFGDEQFVAANVNLNYTIRYENDPSLATAPVQQLEITQQLDPDLDFRSFRLGGFGFDSYYFDASEGLPAYQDRLDFTGEFGVFIDVIAGIDVSTGDAFWRLTAIDPETGEIPVSPLIGFLPPNVDGSEGQGFVTYSIRPRSDVSTGDVIDAEARIIFDINPPIDTPPIANTIDAHNPSSQVEALPAEAETASFSVHWSGEDALGGSGIASYSIYVSTNDGPYVSWLKDTELTSAPFVGAPGWSYRFYSVARDNAGNTEVAPSTFDASTTVSSGIVTAAEADLVITLVHTNEASAVGTTRSSRPNDDVVFHEWESIVAGIWITVDGDMTSEPLSIETKFRWTDELFDAPEVLQHLPGVPLLTSENGLTTLLLEGIDMSGFQVGDQVLVANLLFPVDELNLAGVPINPAGTYPEANQEGEFQIREAHFGREAHVLNIYPNIETSIMPVIYDFDDDGRVGLQDFSHFVTHFGKVVDERNPIAYQFDYDRNGIVGLADFSYFVQAFGKRKDQQPAKVILPDLTFGGPQQLLAPELEAEPIRSMPPILEAEPVNNDLLVWYTTPLTERLSHAWEEDAYILNEEIERYALIEHNVPLDARLIDALFQEEEFALVEPDEFSIEFALNLDDI